MTGKGTILTAAIIIIIVWVVGALLKIIGWLIHALVPVAVVLLIVYFVMRMKDYE